jgi:hypothetical protein
MKVSIGPYIITQTPNHGLGTFTTSVAPESNPHRVDMQMFGLEATGKLGLVESVREELIRRIRAYSTILHRIEGKHPVKLQALSYLTAYRTISGKDWAPLGELDHLRRRG